jgi:hypothetical protein
MGSVMINQIILFIALFITVDYAYAIGATIATALALTGFAYTATAIAINFALSYVVSQILAPNFGARAEPQDQGVRVQVPPDTTATIPMVYGEAYLGGKFVDACLREDQRVMYYVMAISCKSLDSVVVADTTRMYYGDRLITFDPTFPTRVISLTDTAGNVDTKIYDNLFINLYATDAAGNVTSLNGAPMPWTYQALPGNPDPASLMMDSLSGLPPSQQWPSTGRRMNGLVWAMIRLSYNRDAETTQLQPITFYIGQFMKTTATAKPGDVWVDYMTNPIYGAAVPLDNIDLNSANALNVYSDELITFDDYNGNPSTQVRYRINGVIDASKSILDNVDQIMTACDSWMQYNATTGKWAVVINKAEATSYFFDDDNILGSITVGSVDITQMPNQIQGKFPDKTNRDQYNYVNLSVPNNLLYPNEPVNKINVNYELVNNSVQALYLANRTIEQAREDLLVTIDTTYDGIQVDAGDVVSVTNTAYGWNNKLFRAMQVKEVANETGLTAQIQLVEYNAGVYDNFDITQYTPAGNSDTPSAGYFSALSPPAVVNSFPYEATPTFDINVAIPLTGRVTLVTLFYTTATSPTASDWQVLDTQTLSDSVPFGNGSVITFTDYNLAPATYYFAYKVSNDVASSVLSASSIAFNWNPDPANALSFLLTLNPVTLQVPYNGTTPNLTGITFRLYGSNGLGPVQYVTSATDSDPAFVAGTWRIGGSSTTGTGDIVQTGITFPLPPSDAGTYAQFGNATAMTASPATVFIPVRYKDLAGVVRQVSPATLQAVYAEQGQTGNKTATAYLYQWSTTTPANPSGTSIFSWATGASSSYTGGGGWTTTAPANPGVPLIKLWTAQKIVSDTFNATITTVSWTSGYQIIDSTQNGAAGIQTATPTVFQWAATIPVAPTGTSTYTWASSSFSPIPSGWSATPPASPSPGFTLWGASVTLTESAGTTTSTINWTTASISARGYAGNTGTTGASARICYSKTTLSSLASSPATITTTGSTSFPPNGSWGADTVWQATPPSIVAGESVYQSDGVYNPTTNETIWNVPYLSTLKVGSLSAISANLGTITAGDITGVTITGGLFRTAASGTRVSINESGNNAIQMYVGSSLISSFGSAYNGGLLINTNAVGTLYPCIQTYQTSSGTTTVAIPCIYSVNEQGDAIQGISKLNGLGLHGIAWNTGGTNHGIRGTNLANNGGTSTSGLVGVSNGYDFYADGAGTNYGPFTGAHDVLIPNGTNIEIGTICVDVQCIIRKNISNTIFEIANSTQPNQTAIGVFVLNNGSLADFPPAAFIEKYENIEIDGKLVQKPIYYPEYDLIKNDYQYCAINAVGEGQVLVCGENGDIQAGDLIVTSSVIGVGMKQADNIVRSITVAKARESLTFLDTTTPKLIACIYLCG